MNDRDLEKLVFGLAHQIRNPCAIILANANLILKTPGLSPETRRSLESILNGVQYLESRLDEFVEFSRPLRLNHKRVFVAKLVGQVLALLKDKAQLKRAKISSNLEDGLAVQADEDQLMLALLNVFLNSVESISNWGSVGIESRREGDQALIEVKDTGGGIQPRDLPEVFSPFYSTKQGGIGIGLPVSKRIVEAHGGSIEIASQAGQGTVVRIRVPAEPAA